MSTDQSSDSHNPSAAFSTRSIHGGLSPDPSIGAILTPIFQSTSFAQTAVGVHKGYTYTRAANPTVAALERNLGEIEGTLPAAAFCTGMAAISATFLSLLKAGDRVVVSDVVYGGTVRLLRQILEGFGVKADFVDTSDLNLLRTALAQDADEATLSERLGGRFIPRRS
jgi:O-acetylhomoserine/O-acetylserine sulfhydrylase-like pyridoxal-dependent enzyme